MLIDILSAFGVSKLGLTHFRPDPNQQDVLMSPSAPPLYPHALHPLHPPYSTSGPTPTGEMCWTLFLNAANFAGPVAFYIPDLWSHDATRSDYMTNRFIQLFQLFWSPFAFFFGLLGLCLPSCLYRL